MIFDIFAQLPPCCRPSLLLQTGLQPHHVTIQTSLCHWCESVHPHFSLKLYTVKQTLLKGGDCPDGICGSFIVPPSLGQLHSPWVKALAVGGKVKVWLLLQGPEVH